MNKASKKLTKDQWQKIIDDLDTFILEEKITNTVFTKEQFQTKLSSLKNLYNGLVYIKSLSGIGSFLRVHDDIDNNRDAISFFCCFVRLGITEIISSRLLSISSAPEGGLHNRPIANLNFKLKT